MPSIDAPSHGDCFGTLAVAIGLTVGEFVSVGVVAVEVKAEG